MPLEVVVEFVDRETVFEDGERVGELEVALADGELELFIEDDVCEEVE